ncbi:hypothetical protein [Streptomyces sp. NPDC031705]
MEATSRTMAALSVGLVEATSRTMAALTVGLVSPIPPVRERPTGEHGP